ncbi:ferredoxin--NADP reductase [Terricaulis sp.]|uniref:ferredoxin--NADP reductase n=1 Tax=Terricaulis sp. TaxID=2768686 RepID=UPI002AC67348|nr:ferredoxin--NADP reductase [Terricaulis sp.]MDZ4689677.1 ferredoxin--NADP reductase [Terricaulis sp.]
MTPMSFPFLRAMEKPKRSINRMETPAPLAQLPENLSAERVLEVQHYTDRLFRFTIARPASFRFRAGEFVMIGLRTADRPLMRAYSIASAPSAEALEFYSIIVPDGPLTSRLCRIKPGDEVLMARKATGTLVLDALTPAARLFLVSTGTGFAPFASILREPETYAKFKQVIVTHTCRDAAELRYSADVVNALPDDPLVGEAAAFHVMRYATCTRGSCQRRGRITDLMQSGKAFADMGIAPLSPAHDRVMICGSLGFNHDMQALLMRAGFTEGSNAAPGEFVVEKAFVG